MGRVFFRLLGLFVSGLLIGFILGRHYSPDSSTRAVAIEYLEIYGKWEPIPTPLHQRSRGKIVLKATPYQYTWNQADNTVTADLLPVSEIAATARHHKDWGKDLDDLSKIILVAPAGSVLKELVSGGAVSKMSKWEYTLMGVATLGGGFIGYELAHTPDPDTTNDKFVEHMKDAEIWGAVNKDFLALYGSEQRMAISGIKDQKDLNVDAAVMKGLRKMHPEIPLAAKTERAREDAEDKEQQRLEALQKTPKGAHKTTQKSSQNKSD